ncbi:GumC family protein [Hoeflea marina]|nr:GumC family protein [Hoeflea marina]
MKPGARRSLLDHAPADASGTPGRSAPRAVAARQPDRLSLGDRIADLVRTQAAPQQAPGRTVRDIGPERPLQSPRRPSDARARIAPPQAVADVAAADRDPVVPTTMPGSAVGVSPVAVSLSASVWRHRRRIAMASVAGAGAGLLLSLASPQTFHAEARIFIDPRDAGLSAAGGDTPQMSTQAMLAITDGQMRILASTSLLSTIVDELGLARDEEFNGRTAGGGILAGAALISDILTNSDSGSDAAREALERLRSAVSVSRDPETSVITVAVDSIDAEKAALIANRIVEAYLDGAGPMPATTKAETTGDSGARIEAARADLEAAEAEVARFKAESDGLGGPDADSRLLALGDELAAVRSRKDLVRERAEALARADLEAVIAGAFPQEHLSPAILDLRRRYSQARTAADALASSLGPLHPQYVSAKASLEAVRGEIRSELRGSAAAAQAELQRTIQAEQELAQQQAVARVQTIDSSADHAALRELERQAAVKRDIYEAMTRRSPTAAATGDPSTRNATVIAAAEPPTDPAGVPRAVLAAAGAIAGLVAALGTALVAGAAGGLPAYNSAVPLARLQPPPFASYPVAPSVPAPPPAPPPAPAAAEAGARRRDDESVADVGRRGINAAEAALIRTEVLHAAAAVARKAAEVAELHFGKAAPPAVPDPGPSIPAAPARAEPPAPGPSRAAAAAASPDAVIHALRDPEPDPAGPLLAGGPETLASPPAGTPSPRVSGEPYPSSAAMQDSRHPQAQPYLQSDGIADPFVFRSREHPREQGQHPARQVGPYPPQLPPQQFWPQFQPGWMSPQGFVPHHPALHPMWRQPPQWPSYPQWPPHPQAAWMEPPHPPAWPLPDAGVQAQPAPAPLAPAAAPAADAGARSAEAATAAATADFDSNVQAFDDIRRDLERLRSRMVPDRKSA